MEKPYRGSYEEGEQEYKNWRDFNRIERKLSKMTEKDLKRFMKQSLSDFLTEDLRYSQ